MFGVAPNQIIMGKCHAWETCLLLSLLLVKNGPVLSMCFLYTVVKDVALPLLHRAGLKTRLQQAILEFESRFHECTTSRFFSCSIKP